MTFQRDISIIVPTYKRPQDIKRALASAIALDMKHYSAEIVVADNDPAASAKETVAKIIKDNPASNIIYIHVPEPGVSNARNGALSRASGRFLIFLDDDMEADSLWAFELAQASEKMKAAIVFGPVEAVMPEGDDPLFPHMQPLFSRTLDAPEGIIDDLLGTGGALIDQGICSLPSPAFDPSLNETGGEDDAMFAHLLGQGALIGWAPRAKADEHIPPHRSTPAYVWTRNFAFGQGPTQTAADKGLKGGFEVIKWMCIGAVQIPIYGAQYIVRKAMGRADYITSYARLSQAVGKIMWFSGFSPRLYGANAPTGN